MHSEGCRVFGVGCMAEGVGCRVGCRLKGAWCRVKGERCRVQGWGEGYPSCLHRLAPRLISSSVACVEHAEAFLSSSNLLSVTFR